MLKNMFEKIVKPKWVVDEDGDLGIELFGIITLIKYKRSTILMFNKNYPDAAKYVRAD
jgi:hypothetical protein